MLLLLLQLQLKVQGMKIQIPFLASLSPSVVSVSHAVRGTTATGSGLELGSGKVGTRQRNTFGKSRTRNRWFGDFSLLSERSNNELKLVTSTCTSNLYNFTTTNSFSSKQDSDIGGHSRQSHSFIDVPVPSVASTTATAAAVTEKHTINSKQSLIVVVYNAQYDTIIQKLSQSLQLPIVYETDTDTNTDTDVHTDTASCSSSTCNIFAQLGYSYKDVNNNYNDHSTSNSDLLNHTWTEKTIQSIITVSIIPYQPDSLPINDYAIGIDLIDISEIVSTNNKKKKNKSTSSSRRRQHRPLCRSNNKPLIVDFIPPPSSRVGKRLMDVKSNGKQQQHQPDLLQKAVTFRRNVILANNITSIDISTTASSMTTPKTTGITIYDVTAGLGRDSLVMALSSGTASTLVNSGSTVVRNVHMMERNPILHVLLQDGLRRLNLVASLSTSTDTSTASTTRLHSSSIPLPLLPHSPAWSTIGLANKLAKILTLHPTPIDATQGLSSLQQQKQQTNTPTSAATLHDDQHHKPLSQYNSQINPDVIYIDPMFPPRKKTALVKKDMQILHALLAIDDNDICSTCDDVGTMHYNDENSNSINYDSSMLTSNNEQNELQLLQSALASARLRIIVKRPIHALPLGQADSTRINTTKSDSDSNSKDEKSTRRVPRPSYQITGSINRWDIYNLY